MLTTGMSRNWQQNPITRDTGYFSWRFKLSVSVTHPIPKLMRIATAAAEQSNTKSAVFCRGVTETFNSPRPMVCDKWFLAIATELVPKTVTRIVTYPMCMACTVKLLIAFRWTGNMRSPVKNGPVLEGSYGSGTTISAGITNWAMLSSWERTLATYVALISRSYPLSPDSNVELKYTVVLQPRTRLLIDSGWKNNWTVPFISGDMEMVELIVAGGIEE